MNKPDKSSIFRTSFLVALLGSVFGAQAAGLGKLTVYSAIGQPLNAEVVLSATAEELGGLSAKLASHEAFQDAGVEFMPALAGLRMNVGKAPDGGPILRLTTDAPLNEPFLHFLVELNWTAGRMVREYTFLLDPPEMLQVARPASVVAPSAPAVKPLDPPVPPVQPVAVVAAPRVVARAADAGEVHVEAGDTLSGIAREHKPESVSLDQMLVALFNGNRDAFIGDNMNRLRAGRILKLPDTGAVAQVDQREARRMIVSQVADFNAYRRRLAEAATATPTPAAESRQSASGTIRPQIGQKAPPATTTDKLEVSRTESSKQAGGIDEARFEEELIARDKALREASERIARLEKNLESLKRLAEMKSQAGTEAQREAETVATTPAVGGRQKPEVSTPETAVAPPLPKPPVKKPAPPPLPPPEPDFLAENPELVFGGGGLIAVLLGYLGFNAWRRKKQAQMQEVPLPAASRFPAELELPKVGEAEGVAPPPEPVDDVSILGEFSQGALTTEETADPVAEADVLMAYGRDGQAEEILLEGLKSDPGRSAIHMKLVELYANRRDTVKFEAAAKDLHAINRGEGQEWARAVALARNLGLVGALFANVEETGVAESVLETEPVAKSPESLVDEVSAPTGEGPAAPALVAIEAVLAPAHEEAASLDFDLDLGTTSMPVATAAGESVSQVRPAEEAMSLDFDFDLGTPSAPEMPSAAAEPSVPDVQVEDSVGAEVDFDLDLDLDAGAAAGSVVPDAPAETESEAVAAAEAAPAAVPDLDMEIGNAMDEGLDFDLGTEAMAEAEPEPEPEPSSTSRESVIEDLGLSEISLDLDPLPEMESPAAPADVELPALDLDLDFDMPATSGTEVAPLPEADLHPDATPAPAVSVSDAADDPEVATKLELAQAYEEMGDREGARELLNEVLSEGSPAQQAVARMRLDQLDA